MTREQLMTETAISGGHAALTAHARNVEPPAGHIPGGNANAPGEGKSRSVLLTKKLREQASQASQASRATPYTPTHKGGGGNAKGSKGAGKGPGKNGKHKSTPQGTQICFGWNSGTGGCANVRPGAPCADGRAHVCQICLSTEHASKDHPSRGR